ncbi:hypothetical protein ACQKQA_01400 [Pseudomonas sp. NPDC089530]|uniref:hypothetical protein n=1 Tax=Pseudomonas sp. NPDC089530 TaxID=3390651 RepID=UPI003D069CA6
MSLAKKILGLFSLLLILALWVGYFYLYQDARSGRLGDTFDSYGTCGSPSSSSPDFFARDHLLLRVTNNTQGDFTVSGVVNVSERTYNRYELGRYPLKLRLEPLQSSYSVPPLFFEEVKVKALNRNFSSPHKNAYADLESRSIRVYGEATRFPFDVYRYGYKPVLYILKGNEQVDLKFKRVTTQLDLSNTFTPTRLYNPVDYISESNSLAQPGDYPAYGASECAFSIERKGSFKIIVLLLLLVLCLPLLLVVYRDEPTIDFLATLLGVAAVRVFLVGPLRDYQLYGIDFVFGAVIILVGTLSLLKAMRIDALRQAAARRGTTW